MVIYAVTRIVKVNWNDKVGTGSLEAVYEIHDQQTYTVNGIRKRALQNRVNSRQMITLHSVCIHLATLDLM